MRTAFKLMMGLVGLVALPSGGWAAGVSIEDAWAQATPPKATVGRAYMTIINTSAEVDHLVSAKADVAWSAEITGIRMSENAPHVRQLLNFDIPAGGRVDFTPGGYHVLLRSLKKPLTPGEKFKGALTFEKAGVVSVEYVVRAKDRPATPAP